MEVEALVGWIIVAVALVTITTLALWSRHKINKIAKRGYGTAREITREIRIGR